MNRENPISPFRGRRFVTKLSPAITVSILFFLAAASADAFVTFPHAAVHGHRPDWTTFPATPPGRFGPQIEADRTSFIKPFGGNDKTDAVITAAPVFEPPTVVMWGFGLVVIGLARRKFLG
jgi:hypothetical protein